MERTSLFCYIFLNFIIAVCFCFVGSSNKSKILNRDMQEEMAVEQLPYLYILIHFEDKHTKSLNSHV